MRVCLFDPLKVKGGQEKFILDLSKSFLDYFEVFFIHENLKNKLIDEDNNHFNFFSVYSFFNLFSIFSVYRFLKKSNINVLVLNGERALFLGVILKILNPNFKTIYINHLIFKDSINNLNQFKKNLYIKIYFFLISRLDVFISINTSFNYSFKNIKVIYIDNSIKSFERSVLKISDRVNLNENDFVIGYIGRIDLQKGLDTLLKAASLCPKNFKFVLIGIGSQMDNLVELKNDLKLDNVFFLGYSNHPWDFSSNFDIIVYPSRYEGLSLSLLEGMSFGFPIVLSDIPSFKYCLPSNDLCSYFEVGNEVDLALKIQTLFYDFDLRNNIAKSSLEYFRRRFDYSLMLKKYIDIISRFK
jgi:glycosyltransferase involved in cell wall biosynthesis